MDFRLLLYRHHILDVVGGIVIGFFEVGIVAVLWVGPESSASFIKSMLGAKTAGSDAELEI